MDFHTAPILVQMRTTPAFPVRKTFTVDFEVLPAPWVSKKNKKSPGSWSSRLCSLQVVLQNLLICVILFHTVYYKVLGMCCMIFRACELDVLAPLDFKTNPLWLNTNLKVIGFNFQSLSISELNASKNKIVFVLKTTGHVFFGTNMQIYKNCLKTKKPDFEYDLTVSFSSSKNYSLHSICSSSSLNAGHLLCGLLFVLVVEERVWDYAISVTIFHAVITSAGKQNKQENILDLNLYLDRFTINK
ncbi:transmembrane protein 244 [Vulpes lagopus]|uniref:transmembrane protein 244 n=1 Tax=Vulpes lagopus TaxID=494514 RepID=UPI001BC8D266|nr:transmembrane protein 244 [Vulpes lagopus]